MRLAVAAALVAVASVARAAGPELAEQSPQGVAVAGAQAADVEAPAAVYYNPAALAFQPGLTLQAGGAALVQSTSSALGPSLSRSASLAAAGVPAVFIGQRVAARYAVGIGVYDPFAWSASWPRSFVATAQGLSSSLRALAVTPAAAIRPWPWMSLGLGIDIVPTTLSIARVVPDDFSSALRTIDASAVGIGGNAGLLVHVLGRRLDLGVAYRSAMRLDFAGQARTDPVGPLPPLANARALVTTPHGFTFAVAARPLPMLTLTADVRLVLWHALPTLSFTLVDPTGMGPTATDVTRLGLRDTVGVRAGARLALWRDRDDVPRIFVRVGGGFEQSPAPAGQISPLFADGDRGIVAGGVGARFGALSIDGGYAALIGVPAGGYRAVSHVISLAATLRLPDLAYHIDEPDYKY